MKTASQILEAKGYDLEEIDTIIFHYTYNNEEGLDMQTRIHFGFESESVHLWESYFIGDADENTMNQIAKEKGFSNYHELLNEATNHLNSLAESFVQKINPVVYRIQYDGFHGLETWDLLTLDGKTPDETLYFHLKGDAPSSQNRQTIDSMIEEGDWEVLTLKEANLKIEEYFTPEELENACAQIFS